MQEQPKAESSLLRTITTKVSWVQEVAAHAVVPQELEAHSRSWPETQEWDVMLSFR